MNMPRKTRITVLILGAALALSACARPNDSGEFYDPYEATNRKVHAANGRADRKMMRPAALTYGRTVPPGIRTTANNFAQNLSVPGTVVNDLLQFRIGDALHNTLRFAINTTVGIGGRFDSASGSRS